MNRLNTTFALLKPIGKLVASFKFKYKYKVNDPLSEPYIVLSNHVTDFDPIFLGLAFKKPMRFVASEHVARWGFLYKLLKFCFDPILRYKGALATNTIREMFQTIKNGQNVCIFAEGIRSWDGLSCPILPSTGKMVKSARCGMVTHRLTGGYFASPGWSESTRYGEVNSTVVSVYTKEEMSKMTADEINEIIVRDLFEDAYERQLTEPKKYKTKRGAEGLENLLFICPKCGAIDSVHTHGNTVACSACGHSFTYNEYGMLENTIHATVRELAAWQRKELEKLAEQNISLSCSEAVLQTVANHVETIVAYGVVTLSRSGLSCGDVTIPLDDIVDMALHGRRNLVFSTTDNYYELRPAKGQNGLKLLWLYQCYKEQA